MHLEDLLRAVRDEQPDAWKQLSPVLIERLNRYFGRRFGGVEAKDLTQMTMTVVIEQLPGFVPRSTLTAWVYGIARNLANKLLRKRYKQEDLEALLVRVDPTPKTSPTSQIHAQELLALLREQIEQMPPYYRRAIEIELEGGGIATHARLENISPGTARARRHRAYKWLQKRLQAHRQPTPISAQPASTPTPHSPA